jgi:hypothetical protein
MGMARKIVASCKILQILSTPAADTWERDRVGADSIAATEAAVTQMSHLDVRKRSMARSQLRVYYGPQAETIGRTASKSTAGDTVTVPLGEILPLLAEAVRSERTWLGDFEEDDVTISSDLYEVILAYQHFRRPSA